MSNRNQPPFVIYAFCVATYLRKKFELHRRQAEWLCFRKLGMVLNNYHAKVDAEMCAAECYRQWHVSLMREYDTL